MEIELLERTLPFFWYGGDNDCGVCENPITAFCIRGAKYQNRITVEVAEAYPGCWCVASHYMLSRQGSSSPINLSEKWWAENLSIFPTRRKAVEWELKKLTSYMTYITDVSESDKKLIKRFFVEATLYLQKIK